MSEANWIAVALSAIALMGTGFTILRDTFLKYNERRLVIDKLQMETSMAVKTAVLETTVAQQGKQISLLTEELRECKTQHEDSENDRKQLRAEINDLRNQQLKLKRAQEEHKAAE